MSPPHASQKGQLPTRMTTAGRGAQPAGRTGGPNSNNIFVTTQDPTDQTPVRPLHRLQNDLRQLEVEQDASRRLA